MWNLRGVIEGAYHPPFDATERESLMAFMRELGLNAYVAASKLDPWHRNRWDHVLPQRALNAYLVDMLSAQINGLKYIYGLSPVPMRAVQYGWLQASLRVVRRVAQMKNLGVDGILLAFDDTGENNWNRHVWLANFVYKLMLRDQHEATVIVCPQHYHGQPPWPDYLHALSFLDPKIMVCYTGPDIVSHRIDREDVLSYRGVLTHPEEAMRRIVLWDNQVTDDLENRPEPGPIRGLHAELGWYCHGYLLNTTKRAEDMRRQLWTAAQYLRYPLYYDPDHFWQQALHIHDWT